jgi:hypothetical protein
VLLLPGPTKGDRILAAQLERIRVYIRYDLLLVAELRSVLEGIERAYNQMDSFLSGTRRVYMKNRLRVTSVYTEKSLEAILTGNAPTIIALAYLIHLLSKERLLYWQTEKAKWDAKSAERKFHLEENQEKERLIHDGLHKEDRNLMKPLNSLQKVSKQIARSSRIVSVEIQFALDEESAEIETPSRRIQLKDDES